MPVGGGPPQTLSTGSLATPTGATWNRDGVILFSLLAGPIQRISAAGGTAASPVTKRDDAKQQLAHSFPCFLPDGKRFLYYIRSANPEFDGIYVRRPRVMMNGCCCAPAPTWSMFPAVIFSTCVRGFYWRIRSMRRERR